MCCSDIHDERVEDHAWLTPVLNPQPKPREMVIDTMLQYLHTDSACCRDEPGPLADRQAQVRPLACLAPLLDLATLACPFALLR